MPGVSERAMDLANKVLAKCTANDPNFPRPSEAIRLAWAEHIGMTDLPLEDLLAGVTAVYHSQTSSSGFRMLPGHLIAAAHAIRCDRMSRAALPPPVKPPASAEHRVAALAHITETLGGEHRPAGAYVNPLLVSCDFCGSSMREPCTKAGMPGKPREKLSWIGGHPSRIEKAAIAAGHSEAEAARIATVMSQRQVAVLAPRGPRQAGSPVRSSAASPKNRSTGQLGGSNGHRGGGAQPSGGPE